MPLTPEEEAELAELEKRVSPEFLKASGRSVTPAPDNSLGVTGIIGQPDAPVVSPEDSELGRLAAALNPQFDLIPQGLALLPATNAPDPKRREAEAGVYKGGSKGEVKYAYEPPVGLVRKQLLENPNMLRLLRADPPSQEEIAAMDSSSPLYQDAANYMWARTMEDADKAGYTVYRYSKMPWGNENLSFDNLGHKLRGGVQPLIDMSSAFVMGADSIAALGAGRAAMETTTPQTQMHVPSNVDYMGLDEEVEQSTADLNRMNIEENPLSYVGGQAYAATRNWGAPGLIYKGILEGGGKLAQLVARTRLGALAAEAPPAVKGAASLAGEVGAGTGEAVATQMGQEIVGDRAPGGGERLADTAESAALYSAGGAALGRVAGAGANALRNADRLGGAIGRTESNMDWGLLSPFLGPGLKKDIKATVKKARAERHMPGDYIAQEIQPALADVANRRVTSIERSNLAAREQVFGTKEGRAAEPVTRLQEAALKDIRARHQPTDGKPHAVNEKSRPALRVFNTHIADVTTSPVEGAIRLSPSEVDYLSPSWRHRLLEKEHASAWAGKGPPDVERASYVSASAKGKAARERLDEEIEEEIEDRLQARVKDPESEDWPEKGSAEYREVEQEVLAERVEQEAFEETNGSVGDYLRQRGKNAVYVVPYRYDAERLEKIIADLPDGDLRKAALADRASRPLRGEEGGWSRLREKQDAALEGAQADERRTTFENVAKHQTMRPADKSEADLFRGLAREAGVGERLDQLRGINEAVGLQRQAWGRGMQGENRSFFSPSNAVDTAAVRAFPVLRALEPGGSLTGGRMSRLALMGQIEDEAARAAEADRARPTYERNRARLQAEKDEARAKEKKERARRRTEKHRDD